MNEHKTQTTTKRHLWGGYVDGSLDWRFSAMTGLKSPAIFYTKKEALRLYENVRKISFQEDVIVPLEHERL